jgi:hypothetical protein
VATPSRPTSLAPEAYQDWRAYVAATTGLSGSRLTQATREMISSERASSSPEAPIGRPVEPGNPFDGPQGRPGAAWIWDGTKWTRPPQPAGKGWTWDDDSGWTQGEPEGEDPDVTKARETARASLTGLLKRYGLDSLLPDLERLLLEFGGNDVIIMSRLRETEAYKQRFAGIQKRIDSGYSAIDEATYLRMEDEYKKAMRSYGLDASFYSQDRLAELIGNDVSEAEVESRIATGQRIMQSANQSVLRELQEYYPEITNGDLLSYLLDPKAGQEVLSKKIRTGLIGGTAEQAGFTMDLERSQRLAQTSIGQTLDPFDVRTQAQLEQTFGTARETARTERTLAGIDREAYTEMDTLEAAFGDTEKQLASQRRGQRERARFAGESGIGRSSLSRRSRRAL